MRLGASGGTVRSRTAQSVPPRRRRGDDDAADGFGEVSVLTGSVAAMQKKESDAGEIEGDAVGLVAVATSRGIAQRSCKLSARHRRSSPSLDAHATALGGPRGDSLWELSSTRAA